MLFFRQHVNFSADYPILNKTEHKQKGLELKVAYWNIFP